MSGQASVSLKGDQDKDKKVSVRPGKEVEVEMKIAPTPNHDGNVRTVVSSSEPKCRNGCWADGMVAVSAGQTEAKFRILIPLDAPLGEWKVNSTEYMTNGDKSWGNLELNDKPTFTVVKAEGEQVITPKTASVEVKEVK